MRRYIEPHEAGTMVRGISREALVIERLPSVRLAPDPDDNPLLAAALAGEADYLVTGDGGVLGLEKVGYTRILEARTFLREVLRLAR